MNRHQRRRAAALIRRKRCLYRRCGSTRVTCAERYALVYSESDQREMYTPQHGTLCHKCGRLMWAKPTKP